jgi:hypothetical protein
MALSAIYITTPSYEKIKDAFKDARIYKITYNKVNIYFKVVRKKVLGDVLDEFKLRSHNYLETNDYILQRVTAEGSMMFSSTYSKWKENSAVKTLLSQELDRNI